jgi:hypothetical protein
MVGQRKGFTFCWLTNLNYQKLKFPWKRNAHNITASHKFLCQNKTINLSTWMANWISKRWALAINFEAVTTEETWVHTRGLRDRNVFSQLVTRQILQMFGYTVLVPSFLSKDSPSKMKKRQQKWNVGQSAKEQKMKLAGHEELVMILLKWFQQMR